MHVRVFLLLLTVSPWALAFADEPPTPIFQFDSRYVSDWLLLGPVRRSVAPESPLSFLQDPKAGKEVVIHGELKRTWKPYSTDSGRVMLGVFCDSEGASVDQQVVYAAVKLKSDKDHRQIYLGMDDGARAWIDQQLRVDDVETGWLNPHDHRIQIDFSDHPECWLFVEVHNFEGQFQFQVCHGNTVHGELRYPDGSAGVSNFTILVRDHNVTHSLYTDSRGRFTVEEFSDDKQIHLSKPQSPPIALIPRPENQCTFDLIRPVRLKNIQPLEIESVPSLRQGNYACATEMPDGRLLLYERSRGVFCFFDGIRVQEVNDGPLQSLEFDSCVQIKATENGELWLATDKGVFCVSDGRTFSWPTESLAGEVQSIFVRKDACWVVSDQGLDRIDRKDRQLEHIKDLNLRQIQCVDGDDDRLIVVSERQLVDGIDISPTRQMAVLEDDRWTHIDLPPNRFVSKDVVYDRQSQVAYVVFYTGVMSYDFQTQQWSPVFQWTPNRHSDICLAPNGMLYVVNQRSLMVAQDGVQVAQSRLDLGVFNEIDLVKSFTGDVYMQQSARGIFHAKLPRVRILQDSDTTPVGTYKVEFSQSADELLISSRNADTIVGNSRDGFRRYFPVPSSSLQTVSRSRRAKYESQVFAPGGVLSIPSLTKSFGFDLHHTHTPILWLNNGKSIVCKHPGENVLTFAYYCAYYSPDQRFFLGTSEGLWELNGTEFTPSALLDGHDAATAVVTAILLDDDTYWLGTRDRTVLACSATQTSPMIKTLTFPEDVRADVHISAIERFQNDIFVGTSDGLFVADLDQSVLRRVPSELSGVAISDLSCTWDESILWIATMHKGIFQQQTSGALLPFREAFTDDIPSVFALEYFQDEMWVSTSQGVFCYRPTTVSPALFVSHVSINGEPVEGSLDDLQVPYDSNVDIELAGRDDGNVLMFQYKSNEGDWQTVDLSPNRAVVSFRPVDEGEHRLVFRALDGDGNLSQQHQMTVVSVIPFWQRQSLQIAMLTLVSLLALGLVVTLGLYWRSQLNAKRVAEIATVEREMLLRRVCHDLRSPIGVVSACTEMLFATNIDPKHLQKLLADSVKSMTFLSNQLLSYSRSDDSQVATAGCVDIRQLFDQLNETMALTYRDSGVEFRVETDPTLPNRLRLNPDYVLEVLNNLISNSYRFTQSGEIVVRYCQGPNGQLQLEVCDSGQGMDSDTQAAAFHPFFKGNSDSATEKNRHMGLGLTICRKLTHAMGGEIVVHSQPKFGTTVMLQFPASVGDRREQAQA